MGFFDVEDGEGGSVEDRIAIIAVVAFAFCWIPIFLVWKCFTVMRRKSDNSNNNGNGPVTTHNADPEKHPYHLEARIKERPVPTAGSDHRQASRSVEHRSSRAKRHHKNAGAPTEAASNRHERDGAQAAHPRPATDEQHSSSKRHRGRQADGSTHRVNEAVDARVPSRHQSGTQHDERANDHQQAFHSVRL